MTSLWIGPANSAGQAYAWAQAVREFSSIEAWSFSNRPTPKLAKRIPSFEFKTDAYLPSPHWPFRDRALSTILGDASHLLWDGFKPLTRTPRTRNFSHELRWLRKKDLKVGLIAHGSEVRDPDLHMASNPDSYFNKAEPEYTSLLRGIANRNRDDALSCGLPLFVSTPDLLIDLPSAQWLPVTVPKGWGLIERAARGTPLRPMRVTHLPSTREPSIKGSEKIEKVLNHLDARGRITWVRSDAVTNPQVAALFASVDVVVDQVGTNCYGRTSLEAMSVGAIAIAELSDQVVSQFQGLQGPVSCSAEELEAVLDQLAGDADLRRRTVENGDHFVRTFHDGRRAAEVVTRFVGSTYQSIVSRDVGD